MAQKVETSIRFLILGPADKRLRALLFNRGHSHTTRWDTPYDAIIFYGGPKDGDVCPLLYGEKVAANTRVNLDLDRAWIRSFHALDRKSTKIGIGRGAQFLNVMSGGSLYQEVDGHLDEKKGNILHDIKCEVTGAVYKSSSFHKQLMVPSDDAFIMATASVSTKYENDSGVYTRANNEDDDVEAVYYAHTNSLCFQGHPEFHGCELFREYFFDAVEGHIASQKPF